MLPAYLIRAGIDWVRHSEQFKSSNPYSRCDESIKLCKNIWQEQIGKENLALLELATTAAYWAEFFHADDPSDDEREWRDGLIKRSGQYDSFNDWQDWFKQNYAKVYKDDNIWTGALMTSWAHTHQYELFYTEESWEFRPATPYLHTSEMWRFEPHIVTVAEVLHELWSEEVTAYEKLGFRIEQSPLAYLGKMECLGFDTRVYQAVWPPRADKEAQNLNLGEAVADIVLPSGDDWYRHLDNVIFANDGVDITALINKTRYLLGSQRRLFELAVDNPLDKAKVQAAAEGWKVPELQAIS